MYLCKVLLFFIILVFEHKCVSSFFYQITGYLGITESCYLKWIPADINGIESDLRCCLFGQPFASKTLVPVLRHHFHQTGHRKALALSFHGSPGTGKNFVVDLIAKNIFKKGYDSGFFHFFSGTSDFTKNDLNYYKEYLRDFIESKIKSCEWSMFVFDETDKMPDGLLDVVKSYLDTGRRKDGVDFRKATYIFLSNIGESHVIDKTVALWKKHIPRSKYDLMEYQNILFAATFNEKGGLKYSSTVRNALIDVYLPFLPLERAHVEQCIIVEAKRQNFTADAKFIKDTLEEIDFGPDPENIFAIHGCKQIETKVVLRISKEQPHFKDEL